MIGRHFANVVENVLDRFRLRRAPSLPTQIHLSVTDRCFLPCLHCDIWKNEATDLPTEVWKGVINKLGKWCAPASINFVGGEPLLRSDLPELIELAVSYGFTTSLNTNGWLMNENKAYQLHRAGTSIVYVSLDGMKPETIDYTRGKKGSFEKAMQAIEYIEKYNTPRLIIASVLHAGNAYEILQLLEWVEKKGFQLVVQPLYQNFGYVTYDPNWWKDSPLWPKNKQEHTEIEEVLDALTVARMKGRPICNEPEQLQAMKFHFRHPTQDSGLSCRAGHTDLSFDPQGRIRLCYFLEPVGEISDDMDLPTLWGQVETLRRRWEVSRCERHCNLLNCNFDAS